MATTSLQIASAVPGQSSAQLPPFQYQDSKVFVEIPAGTTQIMLAGSSDGSANTSADDKLTILGPDDTVLFQHDYRKPQGGIQPIAPQNVTTAFQSLIGNRAYVTASLIDLQGNSMGCTEFWLVCS